jgi:hypothetical protein
MTIEEENNALKWALVDMVMQHCEERNGVYETSWLTANADALRLLCELECMSMVKDGYGRGVWARFDKLPYSLTLSAPPLESKGN